ncbi:MAG: STAS domain-containing protein [Clostridia bacterium]|nr:STAS domain-containing protein [Clostridia bacterium]
MNIVSKNGCLYVSFDKYIDEDSIDSFKQEIDNAYKSEEAKDMVLDFSGSKDIPDDGVGLALGRYKHVLENDGHMYITGAKGNVDKILKEHNVYDVIPSLKDMKDIKL